MAELTAMDYDTGALRAAAQKIKSCARSLDDGAQPGIKRIRGELTENLYGDAAIKLEQRMNEMNSDVNSMVKGLNGLADVLLKYAADLDRMAQELRAKMN